jgi:hypothetical protein
MLNLRCLVRGHRWGPVEGDNYGAFHTCAYCGSVKRIGPKKPPEAHDKSDVHL